MPPAQPPLRAQPAPPVNAPCPSCRTLLRVRDYDLAGTLRSGQAFRWSERHGSFTGVVQGKWLRLTATPDAIAAETARPEEDWDWVEHYLQSRVDLAAILATFPPDEPMQASIRACPGLRLLRQDPWECLASFILSSTKQIVQIQQIVGLLCTRFGSPVPVPDGEPPAFAFPSAAQLAAVDEQALRECKMGFRAPNLRAAARRVAGGDLDLASLHTLPCAEARERLVSLPGVGPKIANCVLLFAGGFQEAFPVDVWVMKALRQLYFPRRQPSPARLQRFVETHFGPNAGYAQQYLFHYMRIRRSSGGTQ